MAITLDEVRHVATLARLELSPSELETFQGELNALLGHFEDLNQIDVTGLDPKPHAVALRNVWDDDVARQGMPREEMLKNAPNSKAGLFLVPTIIEE